MIWTGDNLAEALALWAAAPRTHAMSWRREHGGLALFLRHRAGGWPKDPITPGDFHRIPVGARLTVRNGSIEVRP